MSRNNVIAVACYKHNKKRRYYVLQNLCMDTQFCNEYIKELLDNSSQKYTLNRGKALIIGHDIQKKIDTEYGVIEIDININENDYRSNDTYKKNYPQ